MRLAEQVARWLGGWTGRLLWSKTGPSQLPSPHTPCRSQVCDLAKQHLRAEGLTRSAAELAPGGAFDGRPADFALQRFLFYQCYKCRRPYVSVGSPCNRMGAPA